MPTTTKSVQIHRQKIKTAQMNADRETKGKNCTIKQRERNNKEQQRNVREPASK